MSANYFRGPEIRQETYSCMLNAVTAGNYRTMGPMEWKAIVP